jgi:hypothetical protein
MTQRLGSAVLAAGLPLALVAAGFLAGCGASGGKPRSYQTSTAVAGVGSGGLAGSGVGSTSQVITLQTGELPVTFAGTTVATGHRQSGSVPVFGGCVSKVTVRPLTILAACGDGNFFLTGLRWTRWDAHGAVGSGIGHQNDCTPDCSRGHFHFYAVAVRLWAPVVCAGLNEFSKLSWRFLRSKPRHVPRAGVESFSCRWRKLRP